ncbi:hypothetical protein WA577_005805 [Blastocystis sp. JDR]
MLTVGNIVLIVELHFLNASENAMMPSLTCTSTVNNNTRHEVCPNTVPLTSASDIKSWTARSPTASAPHSHALNLVRINPFLCASTGPIASPSGFILQPVSDASTGCTSRRTVREQRAQGVQSLPPADEDVGTGGATLSHLLRAALRLPEGHPRQPRAHRRSDARCDPCVVSGKATTHTLSAT